MRKEYTLLSLLLVILLTLSTFPGFGQTDYLIDSSSNLSFLAPNISVFDHHKYSYDDENRLVRVVKDNTTIDYIYEGNKKTTIYENTLNNYTFFHLVEYVDDDGRKIRQEEYEEGEILTYDSIAYQNNGLLTITYRFGVDTTAFTLYTVMTDSFSNDNLLLSKRTVYYNADQTTGYKSSIYNAYNQDLQLTQLVKYNNHPVGGPFHDTSFYSYQSGLLSTIESVSYGDGFFKNGHLQEFTYIGDTLITSVSTKFNDLNNPYALLQVEKAILSDHYFFDYTYKELFNLNDNEFFAIDKVENSLLFSSQGDTVFVHKIRSFFDFTDSVILLEVNKEIWKKSAVLQAIENSDEYGIRLYPNPSAISSRSTLVGASTAKTFVLYNQMGSLVDSGFFGNDEVKYIVAPPSSGTYFVALFDEDHRQITVKTMIVH